jgi:hypothetical protein
MEAIERHDNICINGAAAVSKGFHGMGMQNFT